MSGYEPRFDIDRGWGEDGEQLVRELSRRTLEVKRPSYRDDWLYVELEQNPFGRGDWKPSGLNVTESDYWAIDREDTGIITFIPTSTLRRAIDQGDGIEKACLVGDNPTRGRLLRISSLIPRALPTRFADMSAHGQLSADAHEKPAVSAASRLDLYETFDEYRARAFAPVDPADWEDRIRANVDRMYET
jgi:hypothetical protein